MDNDGTMLFFFYIHVSLDFGFVDVHSYQHLDFVVKPELLEQLAFSTTQIYHLKDNGKR